MSDVQRARQFGPDVADVFLSVATTLVPSDPSPNSDLGSIFFIVVGIGFLP